MGRFEPCLDEGRGGVGWCGVVCGEVRLVFQVGDVDMRFFLSSPEGEGDQYDSISVAFLLLFVASRMR